MSTEPLRRLDKYELLERLGYGGMAEVWKAFDPQLQRYVAIKILHADLQNDPNFSTRFQREAQVIASLRHPNIVPVHDFQVIPSTDGKNPTAFMVMAYVEGQTLANYISATSARGQFPSPTQLVSLFTSISLAVDYAHQKGMIHRDIKPANILLDKRNTTHNPIGEPILTDFGLARLLGTSTGLLTATQPGTPLYTSPEQAQGYAGNERSDIYSLGVILYEMVTGVPPFRGATPVEVLTQHIHATPVSPVLINPMIPPALTLVIMTALAKDPNARFTRASSMTAALAEALHVPLPDAISVPAYPPDMPDMATNIGAAYQKNAGAAMPISPASSPAFTPTISTSSAPVSNPSFGTQAQGTPSLTPLTFQSTTPTTFQSVAVSPVPPIASTPSVSQVVAVSSTSAPTAIDAQGSMSSSQTVQPSQPSISPPSTGTPPGSTPVAPQGKRRWKGIYTVLIALIVLALLGSSLGVYFITHQNSFTTASVTGNATFLSSGQFDFGTAQGIADQLQINLQHVPDAQGGQAYYVWLLGDKHPQAEKDPLEPTPQFTLPLLLGKLMVKQGNATLFFSGTAQHDNLLSIASRMLVTEESTQGTPRGPAADHSTWRYYAEIPQTPYDTAHLSALDHIRHLFYKETKLQVLGLAGGLDVWLFRNTEKIMEWASSARDDYNTHFSDITQIHTLFLNILDYLDGSQNVYIDVPKGSPVTADSTVSKVSLLSVVPVQLQLSDLSVDPPGYINHVILHLNGVVHAPDATAQMRQLATRIIESLNNAQKWLEQVRQDAKQLVMMNAEQLSQASTLALLDDMLSNATYAYIGQLNPTNNQIIPGVVEVHYDIQKLATLTLTPQLPQTI